jgi:hypothetical protein
LSFDSLAGANSLFGACSDFDGISNFTESDSCGAPQSKTCGTAVGPFSLASQQSCSITISFSPQESCPWLPFAQSGTTSQLGAPPALCPFPLSAKLSITSPKNADGDTDSVFAVPVTGIGLSALVPSTPELDFGAEAVSESSVPQVLSFTNRSASSIQVLPALSPPCTTAGVLTLPRPLTFGVINGFQVDTAIITPNGSTINYSCDSDLISQLPNFQISADACTGKLLAPKESCSLQIAFTPQPGTALNPPLDYFLELNTLQCSSTTTSDCEIDSGRFPVELTANAPSSLRMTPGSGLDFGNQPMGQINGPLTITLFNDPKDPQAGPINFTGNLVRGDYAEIDDCGASLAPGASCTLTVTFQPKILGFDPGTITITYTVGQTQTVHLRGFGVQQLQ